MLTDRAGRPSPSPRNKPVQQKVSNDQLGEFCGSPSANSPPASASKTRKSITISPHRPQRIASRPLPKGPGPHTPSKRTKEVEPSSSARVSRPILIGCDRRRHLPAGIQGSARLVGQVLGDYGLAKKKTADTHAPPGAAPRQRRD